MGLEAVLDTLDGVSDEVKEHYAEVDGKFILDIDGITTHPQVLGLSSTKTKERDARKEAEKKYKALKGKTDGMDLTKLSEIDLEEYTSAMAELKVLKIDRDKLKRKKLKDKESWEILEQDLNKEHSEAIKKNDEKHNSRYDVLKKQLDDNTVESKTKSDKMVTSLEKFLKDKEITTALADAKGNISLLMPHVEKCIKVIDAGNDNYVARVFDTSGNERLDTAGNPMTIKQLVEEFKEKPEFKGEGIFADAKKSGGSNSGGNSGDSDSSDTNNPFKKGDSHNLTKQAELFKSDPQLAKKLQKQAAG